MSGLTKKELKDIIKESLKETLSDNAVLTSLISECIKTSILTILKEITPVEKGKTIYKEENRPIERSITTNKPKPVTVVEETRSIFNKDNMRQMMEEELGLTIPNVDIKPKNSVVDMEDTLEDDPAILKALGII